MGRFDLFLIHHVVYSSVKYEPKTLFKYPPIFLLIFLFLDGTSSFGLKM